MLCVLEGNHVQQKQHAANLQVDSMDVAHFQKLSAVVIRYIVAQLDIIVKMAIAIEDPRIFLLSQSLLHTAN